MQEHANPKQVVRASQTWKYLVVEFETPSGNSANSSALKRIMDYPASGAQPEVDCHVGTQSLQRFLKWSPCVSWRCLRLQASTVWQ